MCQHLDLDPEELIQPPGYPSIMRLPRWMFVAQLLVERNVEYSKLIGLGPNLEKLKKLIEKKRKEKFG